jgi:GH15 family glucan-1,4-alpha-glucosidase
VPGLIEDYALISDRFSGALVSRYGAVEWMCLPRFDSAACFAALLGDERNGHWTIAPAGGGPATRRRYRGDSLILESEWDTPDGTVRIIDFMPERGQAPDIVRIVEGVSGRVEMDLKLRLRFDYGRVVPWVRKVGGELTAIAGPDSVWLQSPITLKGRNFTHRARFRVAAGDSVPFVFTWHPSHLDRPKAEHPYESLRNTERFWVEWAARCRYDGPWRDAIVRSLITLKAMTYHPTGGIVAALTTSLPEALGGERNWDYRYCWLRDATMTLEAMLRTGYTEEAAAWRRWLLRAVAGDPKDLQIMYGIAGERRLPEWEVDWLPGYEGSKPVRVGNDAAGQLQLDVYGEVMDALYLARRAGLEAHDDVWALQRKLLDYLEDHWTEPDEGLWEVRGPRRHFVHSKVMCWVAFDRAVRMVEEYGNSGPVERWRKVRDDIHRAVCEHGYDKARNTFTQSYGSQELDAALLLIPQVGFLPPGDHRVIGTIEAVRAELGADGFVRRYPTQEGTSVDGLSGTEGAFLACSFWLANALDMIGRTDEATALFERLLALRNDVGLLAEEYDPVTGRQVGNFPQAFSHMPLILTAYRLAGRGARRTSRP